MELNDAVAALGAALLQTEEVRRFRAVRDRAKADPGARAAMDRYMAHVRSLGGKNTAPSPEQWQSVQRMQQGLLLNPVLQEYLQAESRVGQILHEIMMAAAAACGLETAP